MSAIADIMKRDRCSYLEAKADIEIIIQKIDSLRGSVDTTTERGLSIEEAMCSARNYMMEALTLCA